MHLWTFDIGKDQLRLHPPTPVDIPLGKITCLPGKFCIKRKTEEKTESGLYLPGSGSMDSDCGEVVHAGEGVDLQPGDWVAVRPTYGNWIENKSKGVGIRFYGVEDDWEMGLVAVYDKEAETWKPGRRWRRGQIEKKYAGILELPDTHKPEVLTIQGDDVGYVVRLGDVNDFPLFGSDGYVYFPDTIVEAELELCKH